MAGWIKKAIAGTLVAAAAGLGVGIVVSDHHRPNGGSSSGQANLWVDTNGGTCTRQATAGAYVDAAACSSINAAYQAANAGDTARVKSGTYGEQLVDDTAMTAPGVTFNIEDGTSFGKIELGRNGCCGDSATTNANFITLQGNTGAWHADAGFELYRSHDVTVDGAVCDQQWGGAHCAFWSGGTDATTFKNVDFCCNSDQKLMEAWASDSTYHTNSNITLQKSNFHSIRRTSVDVHNECLLAGAGQVPGLTLDRTHWWGCNVMNINIGCFAFCTIDQSNFHWVGNIFEGPTDMNENDKGLAPFFQGCNELDRTTKPGWVVEYNLFESGWYTAPGCGDTGLTLRGNVGRISTCPGGTKTYNIFEISCTGTGNQAVSASTIFSTTNFPAYTSAGVGQDWHYGAAALMIDQGDTVNFPTTDIAGNARYAGNAPDVGPYETGGPPGWANTANTGYDSAPDYPGSLTAAGSGGCPTDITAAGTYNFCDWTNGIAIGTAASPISGSVTIHGCRVRAGGGNDHAGIFVFATGQVTIDYCTVMPQAVSSPPVSCANSYQYGIVAGGTFNTTATGGLTVSHSDLWGFGNSIITRSSTQTHPHVFSWNWIHDAADPANAGGCSYHHDGPGCLDGSPACTSRYVQIDHNRIEFDGNTNLLAFQEGIYSNFTVTNNIFSGDGYGVAIWATDGTNTTFTDNTWSTAIQPRFGPLYPQDFWNKTGSVWCRNKWLVPSGAQWGTPANSGKFWLPNALDGNDGGFNDSVFVSTTDRAGC